MVRCCPGFGPPIISIPDLQPDEGSTPIVSRGVGKNQGLETCELGFANRRLLLRVCFLPGVAACRRRTLGHKCTKLKLLLFCYACYATKTRDPFQHSLSHTAAPKSSLKNAQEPPSKPLEEVYRASLARHPNISNVKVRIGTSHSQPLFCKP